MVEFSAVARRRGEGGRVERSRVDTLRDRLDAAGVGGREAQDALQAAKAAACPGRPCGLRPAIAGSGFDRSGA